ncbi:MULTISPECIES: alpha/beta hydrolase [Marinitoga]|uniref:alpha/beta hydrolase n=1 Tax=Marinitoga TaxID=160798 RepID=UPI0002E38207|nr:MULTISPECIES: alpha/beta hydrolase [Marinitoga]
MRGGTINKNILKKILAFFVIIGTLTWGGIVIVFTFFLWASLYIINLLRKKLPIDAYDFRGPYTYTYKTEGKLQLKMDIYYPKNHNKEKLPVIFFAHGGGWVSGFRNQPNNVSWCKFIASKGFAVVSIDYRFGISHTMDEILSDYTDALNFIKKNAQKLYFDKNNIILMGLSAGGHLSLLYYSYNTFLKKKDKISGIKGVIAYYAPSDLMDLFDKNVKSVFAKVAVTATLKGLPVKEKTGKYLYYSPIFWINENMNPVLLVHGKEDKVVPFSSSVKLYKKLKEKGVKVKFFVHKYGDHGFEFENNDIQTIKILNETIKFMRGLIKNEG